MLGTEQQATSNNRDVDLASNIRGTVADEEKYMYGKERQATSNNQDVDLAFSINVVVKDEGTTGNQ